MVASRPATFCEEVASIRVTVACVSPQRYAIGHDGEQPKVALAGVVQCVGLGSVGAASMPANTGVLTQ